MLISENFLIEAYQIHIKYIQYINLLKKEENEFVSDKKKQIDSIKNYLNNLKYDNIIDETKLYNEVDLFLADVEKIGLESENKVKKYADEIDKLITQSNDLTLRIIDKYPNITQEQLEIQIINYINKKI